jgi:hypothetical protein
MSLLTSQDTPPNPERIAQEFYTNLYKLFRRVDPWDYSALASIKLSESLRNLEVFKSYPPHSVLHSIEASLAYQVSSFIDHTVTMNDLNKTMNLYYNFSGDFPSSLLGTDLDVHEFLLGMAAEQFYVQERHGMEDLGRSLLLYDKGNPNPKSSQRFRDSMGLSFRDWFDLSFIIFSHIEARNAKRQSPIFTRRNITDSRMLRLREINYEQFLNLSSQPPRWFRERFDEKRQLGIRASYFWQMISSFLEYPIVDFDEKGFLVPHADFLLRNSWTGLHRIVSTFPEFSNEISKSFENYVRSLLELLDNVANIRGPKEVEDLTPGRSADFVLEFSDCVLIVECKTAEYTADLRTRNAIARSNLTGKVAKAFVQISETLDSLEASGLTDVRTPLGIVVTMGCIDFPNADWYRQVVVDRCKKDLGAQIDPACPIQIMPITVFEEFIGALLHSRSSPQRLFHEKREVPYTQCGDWSDFLRSHLQLDMNALMELVTPPIRATEEFFEEMKVAFVEETKTIP